MKHMKKSMIHKTFSNDQLVIDKEFKANLLVKLQDIEGNKTMVKTSTQLKLQQLLKQKNFMYASGFAMLLFIAVGVYAIDTRSENLARQEEINDAIALPENLEGVLGVSEIRALAEADAPSGSTITAVEIEQEQGVVLYKVQFSDGSFRLYDAKTGLAYIKSNDEAEVETESVPSDFQTGITLQEARNIAQTRRPSKTITKIELETENGIVVYSVRFSDEGRVDVNATDGSIVRVKEGKSSESTTSSNGTSNSDSDDSKDAEDLSEEDKEDDGDTSGSDKKDDTSGSSNSGSNSGSNSDSGSGN